MMDIGKSLGGRYKVVRHLGTGGMANVYLGHDLILDRDVAIKVLRFDFRNNEDALRRFQREALSATQLIHPNVVGVYDVDEEDGLNYIVMEYVEGYDLKQYISENGMTAPEKAVHIMKQVLSAMALAHRNRIIHRDIKPQNLLIAPDDTIKVTDFGIAVALSETSLTQTNTLLGSVHYLSPEQARGGMATAKTDIYALGVVLYELLSGAVPFDGESAVSIALKHFQEPIPSVRSRNAAVPQSLENIILKATAKEPIDRYESCEDMLADLETCLEPARAHEAVFQPQSMLQQTKVMTAPLAPDPAGETRELSTANDTVATKPGPQGKAEKKVAATKRRKKWPWVVLGVLLLLSSILYLLSSFEPEPELVRIPDVAEVNRNTAIRLLADAGLQIGSIEEEYSEEVADGFVIRTFPNPDQEVEANSKVDLYVSQGPEPITLRDYEGETYEEAREELLELGFNVERKEQNDPAVSETIVAQSIASETTLVPDGRTITLTVSIGEETFAMADLAGYTRVSVEDYADSNGISVSFQEANSEDVPEGLVIDQSLPPGTSYTAGQELTVTLSTGPAEPEYYTFTKTIIVPYVAPPDESPAQNPGSNGLPADNSNGNAANKPGPNENANPNANENTDNQEAASSTGNTPPAASNHVIIYMQDADHKIEDIFREFDITADTNVNLNFRVREGEGGGYRVVRDGEAIMEESGLTE